MARRARSKKKDHQLRRHFAKRLQERYGIALDDRVYDSLLKQITNSTARCLGSESLTRSHHIVLVEDVQVRVVYNKSLGAICTALPFNEHPVSRIADDPGVSDED